MAAKSSALVDKIALYAPHLVTEARLPAFVYGTAWKKEATKDLVFQALTNGFRAIDTACQPKHYREDLVGDGLREALARTSLKRADVCVQTKFTPITGQDPRSIPYDHKQPIAEQVRQSVEVSLKHFDVSDVDGSNSSDRYLDGVVLHSPMQHMDDTMEVWRTLESYVPNKIRNIGISNCDLFTLMDLVERTKIKPAVVQNRFYHQTRFDIGLRKICDENHILYQSFWALSANPELLRLKPVQRLSTKLQISRESALYCLILGLGNIIVLNGSTKLAHIKDDCAALAIAKDFSASEETTWLSIMKEFRTIIGEKGG